MEHILHLGHPVLAKHVVDLCLSLVDCLEPSPCGGTSLGQSGGPADGQAWPPLGALVSQCFFLAVPRRKPILGGDHSCEEIGSGL